MERKRALATAAAITMSVVSGAVALGANLPGSSAQPSSVPPVATQSAVAPSSGVTPRVVTIVVPNKSASQPRGHESDDGARAGGHDD
jgi:hypothetical protein